MNACEHTKKDGVTREFPKVPPGGCKRERDRGKLSEVNTRAVSRGQNELIGKFKMAEGDVISIRGQIMEYTYIPIGSKRELLRSGVACDWKG